MYIIQDVPHDNSCLFHSVARFTNSSGPELRKLAVQTCINFKEKIFEGISLQTWIEASEGPFDAYIQHISKHTTWGGYIELFLLSIALQRQIAVYVLHESLQSAKKLVHIGKSGDPILLLYVQNNHYMALLKQK
jgi:hypothetical protein